MSAGDGSAEARRAAQVAIDAGLEHHRDGELAEALDCYAEAIGHDASHADAHNLQGLALLACDELEGAQAAVERAVALQPGIAHYRVSLGKVLLRQGDSGAAGEAFSAALELDPALVEAHNDLGNARLAAGDRDGAIASYSAALEQDPEYPLAALNLASTLQEEGRHAEAEQRYRDLLRDHPGHVEARSRLALLVGGDGRYEEALELCVRCRLQQPDDPVLAQRMLYFAALAGRWEHHRAALRGLAKELREELAEVLDGHSLQQAAAECRRSAGG
ncbi:MAG TPA: tetratricopeptide repeat protein [Gammaproteobacteria bacterium]